MEKIDEKLEQRVWQRVQGQTAPLPLKRLAAAEKAAGALFLMLARLQQNRGKEQLRQLYHRTQTHGRYLCGMQQLLEGQPLFVHTAPPEPARTAVLLSKGYVSAGNLAAEYEKHRADPSFGPIFDRMARGHRETCAVLLELLGTP